MPAPGPRCGQLAGHSFIHLLSVCISMSFSWLTTCSCSVITYRRQAGSGSHSSCVRQELPHEGLAVFRRNMPAHWGACVSRSGNQVGLRHMFKWRSQWKSTVMSGNQLLEITVEITCTDLCRFVFSKQKARHGSLVSFETLVQFSFSPGFSSFVSLFSCVHL